eukprot:7697232-Alexandrium_andersonii.AAC.1
MSVPGHGPVIELGMLTLRGRVALQLASHPVAWLPKVNRDSAFSRRLAENLVAAAFVSPVARCVQGRLATKVAMYSSRRAR